MRDVQEERAPVIQAPFQAKSKSIEMAMTSDIPDIAENGSSDWLGPSVVKDTSDGKLMHLDGVNLPRPWNLVNIAVSLAENNPRNTALISSANLHEETGVAAVSDRHYSGFHWLASFAIYLKTFPRHPFSNEPK